MSAPAPGPSAATDQQSSIPGERYALVPHETLEPMWCGQHGLVSRVGESSGQRDERLHVAPGIQR
jgi:hypothetical protein